MFVWSSKSACLVWMSGLVISACLVWMSGQVMFVWSSNSCMSGLDVWSGGGNVCLVD